MMPTNFPIGLFLPGVVALRSSNGQFFLVVVVVVVVDFHGTKTHERNCTRKSGRGGRSLLGVFAVFWVCPLISFWGVTLPSPRGTSIFGHGGGWQEGG